MSRNSTAVQFPTLTRRSPTPLRAVVSQAASGSDAEELRNRADHLYGTHARKPPVRCVHGDHPQVFGSGGYEGRSEDKGGDEDVRLHQYRDDDVLADNGTSRSPMGMPHLLLLFLL